MKTISVSIKGQNPDRQKLMEDREEHKDPAQRIMEVESEPESHNITKTITMSIPEKLWVEFGALVNLQKVKKGTAAVNAISDYVDKYRNLFDSLNINERG